MTSIVTVSPMRNIYEQVKWKCKAYSSMFSTVLIVYILMGLLSGGMSGSLGTGTSFVNYEEQFYSLDGFFIYTIMLMLILGWMLASKQLSRQNYSIVTTNLTEVVSTGIFLIVLCVFTLAAAVSTLTISVLINLLSTGDQSLYYDSNISFIAIIGFIVCTLLAASVGYFLHAVFNFSKIAFIILAVGMFLLIRQYTFDTWQFVFGNGTMQIIGRSAVYVVILWLLIALIRRKREVTRQ
ncbi:silver transporter [Solibacillus sp. FSL K6-1781]|uniref:silver transporter n=1 Tax=Solibacillus sp. FSL K6-1781 TaxID=2921474 RepID=UPI003159DE73